MGFNCVNCFIVRHIGARKYTFDTYNSRSEGTSIFKNVSHVLDHNNTEPAEGLKFNPGKRRGAKLGGGGGGGGSGSFKSICKPRNLPRQLPGLPAGLRRPCNIYLNDTLK